MGSVSQAGSAVPLRRDHGLAAQGGRQGRDLVNAPYDLAFLPEELALGVRDLADAVQTLLEEADAAYYASSARAAVDPDPAQWIVGNETRALDPVSADRSSGGSAPSAR